MNPKNMCMGCMKEKTSSTPLCPLCGYDESERRSPLVMRHRTLLADQYVVGKVLGKPGGFGITYLGWDTRLETMVAIKEYLPRDNAGRDTDRSTVVPHSKEDGEIFRYGLEAFLVEARTLAKFDHANVVRVRTFFEGNGTAYLVMDYYDGMSLESYLIQKGGKITEKLAVNIMMPVLDGLREVHEKGFLHRDIKPHNIYLTKNGKPILLDFGAARSAMGDRSRSLSVLLTPGYAPYEQYQRKGKQGVWTDIYACGATLYRMVIGKTPPEAIERERDDDLIAPSKLVNVSRGFQAAVLKSLEMQPSRRQQSIKEFQDMLFSLVYSEPLVLEPEPEPPSQSLTPPAVTLQEIRQGMLSEQLENNMGKNEESPFTLGKLEQRINPLTAPRPQSVSILRRPQIYFIGVLILFAVGWTIYKFLPATPALTIASEPFGANVIIDGNKIGLTPLKVMELSSGNHSIEIRKQSYEDHSEQVVIKSDQPQQLLISLIPLGKLTVTSTPSDAEVYVDGDMKGNTPLDSFDIAKGIWNVEVRKNGYETWQKSIEILPLQQISIDAEMIVTANQIENYGILNIKSTPSGAEVYVDGEIKGNTPLNLREVVQGNRNVDIKIRQNGYDVWQKSVQIVPFEQISIDANLVANYGNLNITSNPSGASVYVDGEIKGNTPLDKLELTVGKKSVEIKKSGYENWQKSIEIFPLQQLSIDATLASTFSNYGTINITSTPSGANVYLDKKYVGKTPDLIKKIEKGEYSIKISKLNYEEWSGKVTVKDGEPVEMSISLKELSMVRDNVTGLVWEIKNNMDNVKNYTNPHDADNEYTWYDSNTVTNAGRAGNGTDTEDFIKALNYAHFGGYSDWRLPTKEELKAIFDKSYENLPFIDTNIYKNTNSSFYWSSSTSAGSTNYAWGVDFKYGSGDYRSKLSSYYARAVRGGQ